MKLAENQEAMWLQIVRLITQTYKIDLNMVWLKTNRLWQISKLYVKGTHVWSSVSKSKSPSS